MWLVLANKVLPVGKWEIGADKGDVSYSNAMLSLWITCPSCAPSPDLYDLMCYRLQGTDKDDIYRHSLVDCLGLDWWKKCSNFSGSHVLLIYDIWMSRNLMIFLEQVFIVSQVAHGIREVMEWKRILIEKPSSCSLMHYIDKEKPRSFQESMKRSIRYLWSWCFVFFHSSFHLLL